MKDLIKKIKPAIVKIALILVVNGEKKIFNLGSGFIVSKNGYIVTCNHVIQNPPVQVLLDKGGGIYHHYPTKLVFRDEKKDFAILKIDEEFISLNYLELGDFEDVEEGEESLFGGFPLEVSKPTFSRGMISVKGKDILPGGLNVYQIDGSVNNGNSGGPLVSKECKVVGIITSKYSEFNALLKEILDMGKMTGVSIGNEKKKLDIGETFYNILKLMKTHVNVGIGHAFSIEYAKEKLKELKIIN